MSEEGEKTKQKHFVLNVEAASWVGNSEASWGSYSVKLLVSFCFCLIKTTGNIAERGRYPGIPEVSLKDQSSSKVELM